MKVRFIVHPFNCPTRWKTLLFIHKNQTKMGKIQCAERLKVEKMLQFINSIKSGFNVSVPHERREFVQLQFIITIQSN